MRYHPRRVQPWCLALLLAGTACGGDGPTDAAREKAKLTLFSAQALEDTVDALVAPIEVGLTGYRGTALGSVDIVLSTDIEPSGSEEPAVRLARSTPVINHRPQLTMRTEADGRIRTFVRLGGTPGSYTVRISVPAYELSTQVAVTIHPGRPVRIAFTSAADTAVQVGASYQVTAVALDRRDHPTAFDPLTLVSRRPDVAALGTGMTIRAVATGRTYVVATAGAQRDSAGVSVVPPGRILAFRRLWGSGDSTGFFIFDTDGTGGRRLESRSWPYNNRSSYFSSPGDRVVFHHGILVGTSFEYFLHVADTIGNTARVIGPTGGSLPQPTRDGSWIYFTAQTGYAETELWRVRPDGSQAALVGPPGVLGTDYGASSPSPLGDRLAVATRRQYLGQETSLDVLDIGTGIMKTIRPSAARPRWSPVADEIAYFGPDGIEIVRPDGSEVLGPITPGQHPFDAFDASDGQLDWSPDGQWLIACANAEYSGERYLALIARSDGEVIPLPFSRRRNLCQATWRPS